MRNGISQEKLILAVDIIFPVSGQTPRPVLPFIISDLFASGNSFSVGMTVSFRRIIIHGVIGLCLCFYYVIHHISVIPVKWLSFGSSPKSGSIGQGNTTDTVTVTPVIREFQYLVFHKTPSKL